MTSPATNPRTACVGGGVIGAGWAARLVLNGLDVALHDPDPDAARRAGETLAGARRAYRALFGIALPREGTLRLARSVEDAVCDAFFVQESVPERLDLKRGVLAAIDAAAPAHAIIASSTSGLLPSHMQQGLGRPGRVLVGHPFNPVYLLPLVEVVAGRDTDAASVTTACDFYRGVGMSPVVIRKEIDAFVGDRLQEALWREALWLVNDGVASVSEVDDVIRHSFGLRWAQMGVFQVYRTAGGEAGMRHFLEQFGPCLKWPWTRLTDVPDLTGELVERIAGQSDEQAQGLTIRELERIRDDNLVALMGALEHQHGGWGAGALLAGYRAALAARAPRDPVDPAAPLELVRCAVQAGWLDYNGHMTEHRYVQVFGDATDALLRLIGVDQAYVDAGHSYYTVENHVAYRGEARLGDHLLTRTQVLHADDRRLHLFHWMSRADGGEALASSEQMLLHVDSGAGRACAAPAVVLDALSPIVRAHARLPRPASAGRAVGQRGTP